MVKDFPALAKRQQAHLSECLREAAWAYMKKGMAYARPQMDYLAALIPNSLDFLCRLDALVHTKALEHEDIRIINRWNRAFKDFLRAARSALHPTRSIGAISVKECAVVRRRITELLKSLEEWDNWKPAKVK